MTTDPLVNRLGVLDQNTIAQLVATAETFGWSVAHMLAKVAPRLQDLIEVEGMDREATTEREQWMSWGRNPIMEVVWYTNAKGTVHHAYYPGPGLGDRSYCGRAEFPGPRPSWVPRRCSYCERVVEAPSDV